MTLFRVRVPFAAFSEETVSSTSATHLKLDAQMPNMTLCELGPGSYVAELSVAADGVEDAAASGIVLVEELIQLLALENDRFEVAAAEVDVEPLATMDSALKTIEASVVLSYSVFVRDHLGLTKVKSVARESAALAKREWWPPHVRRGLEMNYNAVCSISGDVRFAILISALEMLARATLGNSPSLLGRMPADRYEEFKSKLDEFLGPWELSPAERDRLRNHLLATHADSMWKQLLTYVESKGLTTVTSAEVREWWSFRGRIAHGEHINADELRGPVARLGGAVRGALRKDISDLRSAESPLD
jgi:hypothetical protein